MSLTVEDLERFQSKIPNYPMELVNGEIIIMSPSGLESEEVAIEIGAQLRNWVRSRKLGRVIGSSGGYILPNATKDVRAPDASFIRADRLKRTTPDYAKVVPDLIFEVIGTPPYKGRGVQGSPSHGGAFKLANLVRQSAPCELSPSVACDAAEGTSYARPAAVKSKTDSLEKLRQKIQVFLELGTQVGVLVDPRTRTMEVYRLGQEKIVLQDGDILTVPDVLPGWELMISEIWAPEFD